MDVWTRWVISKVSSNLGDSVILLSQKIVEKVLKGGSAAKKFLWIERRLKHPQHVGDAESPDFCTNKEHALLPCQHYIFFQHWKPTDLVAPERC